MTNRWNVTVKGRERQVTVDQAETGKDVIRVDGRTAARPLTPEEQERVFAIDGFRYSIRRDPDGFAIAPVDEPQDPLDQPPNELPHFAAQAATPGPDRRLAQLTRYWWLGVVAAVGLMMYWALPNYATDASKRVEAMLLDLKDGPDHESSVSASLWARNVRVMDANELSHAHNTFTQWRRQKDFHFTKGFTAYRIIEARKIEGGVPTALVTFEIDGQVYRVIVPERLPIFWAD